LTNISQWEGLSQRLWKIKLMFQTTNPPYNANSIPVAILKKNNTSTASHAPETAGGGTTACLQGDILGTGTARPEKRMATDMPNKYRKWDKKMFIQ
jgi:hypothetical protein